MCLVILVSNLKNAHFEHIFRFHSTPFLFISIRKTSGFKLKIFFTLKVAFMHTHTHKRRRKILKSKSCLLACNEERRTKNKEKFFIFAYIFLSCCLFSLLAYHCNDIHFHFFLFIFSHPFLAHSASFHFTPALAASCSPCSSLFPSISHFILNLFFLMSVYFFFV
jgi:hypothetical protein